MRSLLRASRRRHIGALKSYIPYAVGEIFLVVVGILIALEVNNYNDVRKERDQEVKVLLSLHYEIAHNIKTLNRSVEEKQRIVEINREILRHTGPNAHWNSSTHFDSLMMYYTAVSG